MGILSSVTASGSTGEIIPAFKYNAVQGRAYKIEREQDAAGNWNSREEMVQFPIKFALDLANIEVGQMAFIANRPDFHLVPLKDVEAGTAEMPAKPSADHRPGFRVRLYNKSMGLRELRGQAKCLMTTVDGLYEEFKAAPEAQQGLVPVVELYDVKPQQRGGQYPGTDMVPLMRIVKWTERPEELTAPAVEPMSRSEQPPIGGGAPQAAPAPSAHVPPPAAAPAAPAPADDGDEF